MDQITSLTSKLKPVLGDLLKLSHAWTAEAEDHRALYNFVATMVDPVPKHCAALREGMIIRIHKALTELDMVLRGFAFSFGMALPLTDNSRVMTNRALIGTVLPLIYESFFERKFGIARDPKENALKGSGVRFLAQVVEAMGVKGEDGKRLSTESLVSYWRSEIRNVSSWTYLC